MVGTRYGQGPRIESVSWHGHQIVLTYDEAVQKRHIWVEANGSPILHLVENSSGLFNIFKGDQPMGELLVNWDNFKPEYILHLITEKDLDGWR